MPSTRETNTMSEVINRIMQEITKAKQLPDADLAWLVDMETKCISYLRNPQPNEAQGGAPQGMVQQAPPGTPGVGGGFPMPGMPNPDELRRLIGQ